MSQEPIKMEQIPLELIDQTHRETYDRPYPAIAASIVPSLSDYLQELEGHLVDHIIKIRNLEETLLLMASSRRTSVPIADTGTTQSLAPPHISNDPVASLVLSEPTPQPNTKVADPAADPKKPSVLHVVIDVTESDPAAETSRQPPSPLNHLQPDPEISIHLEQLHQFLDRHLHNIASLQFSLPHSSVHPTTSNPALSTQLGTDSGSGIFNPTIKTREDWERRQLREEHKMWAQVFSTIVVISTFLTATVISAMSLGQVVWDQNKSLLRGFVVQFGSASFLCAFTTTVIATVSAAKAAYNSHAGFRGRRLPGIRLRLFLCGGGLTAGFVCLYLAVNMTMVRFLKQSTTEGPYSIAPGLIFLSILLVYVYVDVFGRYHSQWLRQRVVGLKICK